MKVEHLLISRDLQKYSCYPHQLSLLRVGCSIWRRAQHLYKFNYAEKLIEVKLKQVFLCHFKVSGNFYKYGVKCAGLQRTVMRNSYMMLPHPICS